MAGLKVVMNLQREGALAAAHRAETETQRSHVVATVAGEGLHAPCRDGGLFGCSELLVDDR